MLTLKASGPVHIAAEGQICGSPQKKLRAGGLLADLFGPEKKAKTCKTAGILRAGEVLRDLLEMLLAHVLSGFW